MTSVLSRHIEILLLDNDCVIVPGFGGFMAHHKDAEYVEEEGLYLPPQRTLGFNPQLQLNDSLLAQSYVESYDISYPEAIRKIEAEVEEIKQKLSFEGEYEFYGIGTVLLKSDNNYEFEPCQAGLLTPSLYALYSFAIDKLEKAETAITLPVKQQETEDILADNEAETEFEYEEKTINISISTLRNVLAAAIFLLLFVFSSIPVGTGSTNVSTCSFVDTELISSFVDKAKADYLTTAVKITPDTTDTSAHKAETTETETKASNTVEQKKEYYSIVLASKVSKSGAEEYVAKLKKAEYKDATVYQRGSMTKVIYGEYSTEEEAASALRTLRSGNEEFAEAWVSVIR